MRVALDTNVLVAAFATRGLCSDLFRLVLAEHDLVVTEVLLQELERALTVKLRLPQERKAALVDFLSSFVVSAAAPADPAALSEIEVRDKDDIEVVRSVVAAGAEVLVSGDKDLLEAKIPSALGLQVVSPRGFWEMLRGRPPAPDEVHEPAGD